jgi:hypothetical protein
MKPSAVIVDLDGTLCDISHRRHLVEGDKKEWGKFFDGILQDKVNGWCQLIIRGLISTGVDIVFVTGRPEKCRASTTQWLSYNGLGGFPVYMRQTNDFRKDDVAKQDIYEFKIRPFYNILFCIDDRQQVVDMWRKMGLTCLQCAPGDF